MNTIQYRSTIGRLALVGVLTCTLLPGIATGQSEYPTGPVKFVVPVAPGGAADLLPRIVAEKLALRWNQPVTIENRPGAALNLAARMVAKATPDGHTLLATPPGPLAINRYVSTDLGYDPAEFTPVTVIASLPFVLVVGPSVKSADLRQFIAHAKANPGKLSFGSPGVGSPPFLAAEQLKARAGIDLLHVPYKGLAPAFTDLMGGRLDIVFWDLSGTLSHLRAGKARALGAGSLERLPELPDVPAIAEFLPGFLATTWFAVAAPPNTSPAIAAKIASEIAAVVKFPDVAQRFRDMHAIPVAGTPEQTAAFLRTESERWRQVIAAAGLKAQ